MKDEKHRQLLPLHDIYPSFVFTTEQIRHNECNTRIFQQTNKKYKTL